MLLRQVFLTCCSCRAPVIPGDMSPSTSIVASMSEERDPGRPSLFFFFFGLLNFGFHDGTLHAVFPPFAHGSRSCSALQPHSPHADPPLAYIYGPVLHSTAVATNPSHPTNEHRLPASLITATLGRGGGGKPIVCQVPASCVWAVSLQLWRRAVRSRVPVVLGVCARYASLGPLPGPAWPFLWPYLATAGCWLLTAGCWLLAYHSYY